ncbi:MAG TPA: imidazolonepropionase [Planctomycetota bacterium]|nr:imidazolonepropionase [Planctomycetota bacterium]
MLAGAPSSVDLLVGGASAVATCVPARTDLRRPARRAELGDTGAIAGGAVAIDGGRIVAVGAEPELRARYAPRATLDARGGVVIPGLVDAHTHPVFVGGREDEFERRTRGETYAQIAAAGGGIVSSVRALRAASDAELEALVRRRLDRFVALGTTTVEAKSGYGLSVADELRSLRVLAAASRGHAARVVPTLLAAHALPPERTSDRSGWLRAIRDEIAPAAARERLAVFHDVFVDAGYFTVDEARELLASTAALGLRPKLHADELGATGATELAVDLGAASADHLDHVSPRGVERIAASETIAVLTPGVSHFLRAAGDAPARALIDAGAAVAVATDYNPGTCPSPSLFEAMHLACVRMRLSAAEALVAATRNAAFAVGLGGEAGVIAPGARADLVVCDVPDLRDLVYAFGRPPVAAVVAAGRVVPSPDPSAFV